MTRREKKIARAIRWRITTPPYFTDFIRVSERKSASLAIYIQERCSGNTRMAAYHRHRHFEEKTNANA